MACAVVTGSSSGIGLATARKLSQRGYSVVLHGHSNLKALQLAAAELRFMLAPGASLHCVAADIACQRACRQLVETCFHLHPSIDLWVNNAGADVLTESGQRSTFESKLERLWKVDVLGTIRLSRLAAGRMQSSRANLTTPSIINIGWDQAQLGMEGDAGQMFGTTKAAITAFTSAFSLSVAPHIRVNTVAPGWIQTAWGRQSASPYWNHRAVAESQLERWGTADDVAETICWLASPAASFIAGQTICVNGGRRFYNNRS